MELTRLRIVGFKTFVDPVDISIQPGLTGIVGPNGCGKSNLVEALRWVMGESSHKNMRAAGMDDVIFSGASSRPARNMAEVVLAIDNAARTAPAAFNDHETLEVSRRIERQEGSSYRVNGREVRARDVQLLFADAATGARSPSLVRQGQISELIQAKPQARRRILEDAAGIAGLHARRHEAELRLRQAEENLARVEDILGEIGQQAEGLKRQGRQAARYRTLSAEIRKLDALLLAAALAAARAEVAEAHVRRQADAAEVTDRAAEQARAARDQAVAAHAVEPAREAEIVAAAALRRLSDALSELDHAERSAKERLAGLERRIAELGSDLTRGEASRHDAAGAIVALDREALSLVESESGLLAAHDALAAGTVQADALLSEAETEFMQLQGEAADARARRAALEAACRAEEERAMRLDRERERVARDLAEAEARETVQPLDALRATLAAAEEGVRVADAGAAAIRGRLGAAREDDAIARSAGHEVDRLAGRLETELRTLSKLLSSNDAGRVGPTMLDRLTVAPGYEAALGAALGDDLDASEDPVAPLAWRDTGPGDADPVLPPGIEPLSGHVEAPPAMLRRLRQIGVADAALGASLATQLRSGQRLVSLEGDLWRWDGLSAAADAPSRSARRLAEKNRLDALSREAGAARSSADGLASRANEAAGILRALVAEEARLLDGAAAARRAEGEARERVAGAERRTAETAARLAGLREALGRLGAAETEASVRRHDAEAALAGLAQDPGRDARLAELRVELAELRLRAAEARAGVASNAREREIVTQRRAALSGERSSWQVRAERAAAAAGEIAARLSAASAERRRLADMPDAFLLRRRGLQGDIAAAESRRRAQADALALVETTLAEADRAAKSALDALAQARERRAGSEARAEASEARLADVVRGIAERMDTDPDGLLQLAGLRAGELAPPTQPIEARLVALRDERERLGGVNLRAEDELAEIEGKRARLGAERDDLTEAIRRLRGAVSSLNREGRERLAAAFAVVQGHFGRLFSILFEGGSAELALIDSDDPLEAGLEITARPPGKRPQSLSLLSGGEQALTATALIFAVFLTNPSPICVLDEVDAPLDDANVERYCDLLVTMVGETATRFIVITHNPITMARMDRLFGVTMAERGVSQLVSVDLENAERVREAG